MVFFVRFHVYGNPTNPDWWEDRFFIGLEGRRELGLLKKPKRFVPEKIKMSC
jgi:hypothetical protein